MIIASKRMGKGDFRSDKNQTGAYLGRDLEIVKFYCFDASFFFLETLMRSVLIGQWAELPDAVSAELNSCL